MLLGGVKYVRDHYRLPLGEQQLSTRAMWWVLLDNSSVEINQPLREYYDLQSSRLWHYQRSHQRTGSRTNLLTCACRQNWSWINVLASIHSEHPPITLYIHRIWSCQSIHEVIKPWTYCSFGCKHVCYYKRCIQRSWGMITLCGAIFFLTNTIQDIIRDWVTE